MSNELDILFKDKFKDDDFIIFKDMIMTLLKDDVISSIPEINLKQQLDLHISKRFAEESEKLINALDDVSNITKYEFITLDDVMKELSKEENEGDNIDVLLNEIDKIKKFIKDYALCDESEFSVLYEDFDMLYTKIKDYLTYDKIYNNHIDDWNKQLQITNIEEARQNRADNIKEILNAKH